ncbi:MAG: HIT family protein [Mycobacterium sp.]|nr:HIT family protein [Mycobacterium sp.]MBV9721617.1 HIT family protein [Mycobacterium sp.]
MSCDFCSIVAGEVPGRVFVYEDDEYIAILDIRAFTRGHTLVIPRRHSVDLTDTSPETMAGMITVGQRIAQAARATELADGTNIGINDGRAAAQSVFHIHLHVVPRLDNEPLKQLAVGADGKVMSSDPDPEATGRILRDALAQIDAIRSG